jgi:hypothetical protein
MDELTGAPVVMIEESESIVESTIQFNVPFPLHEHSTYKCTFSPSRVTKIMTRPYEDVFTKNITIPSISPPDEKSKESKNQNHSSGVSDKVKEKDRQILGNQELIHDLETLKAEFILRDIINRHKNSKSQPEDFSQFQTYILLLLNLYKNKYLRTTNHTFSFKSIFSRKHPEFAVMELEKCIQACSEEQGNTISETRLQRKDKFIIQGNEVSVDDIALETLEQDELGEIFSLIKQYQPLFAKIDPGVIKETTCILS